NGFWVSLEPRFQVLDAPGLFDDILHGNKVVNDPAIRSRLATFGMDKGVEILAPGVYSPMMLLTHKGVRTAADFQGQKVRTQGGAPIQVEPIVREEGRKAEVLFTDWNVADIKRAEEVWRKNGGELITLPPAEAKRY